MPSSPVHLKVAYMLADKIGINNKPDFLLGAISPDCVNYGVSQASEEVRYRSHIRVRDYDKWKENLRNFYGDNKEKYSGHSDFLKGYLFHMWTDIAWDEVIQPKLFEYLGTLGYGYDDMTPQKWKELYRFNSMIVKEDDYKKAAELVKNGVPAEIAGCSTELIGKYRDYVANDYKDKILDEKPLFLNNSHIEDTINHMIKMNYIAFE